MDGSLITRQCGCITCGDEATPARVTALLAEGTASAETGGVIHEINIELCDVEVGDTVLVHAGVAIAKLAP